MGFHLYKAADLLAQFHVERCQCRPDMFVSPVSVRQVKSARIQHHMCREVASCPLCRSAAAGRPWAIRLNAV
jgi:hypothetical protein